MQNLKRNRSREYLHNLQTAGKFADVEESFEICSDIINMAMT